MHETTGRGTQACMKQQVLLNKDRCPHKCELGNRATYPTSFTLYSTTMAALRHLIWQTKCSPACVLQPCLCVCVTAPSCDTALSEQSRCLSSWSRSVSELTEPCWMAAPLWAALTPPTPQFKLFPCSHLLIRFSASAEWVKHNYNTYVRGKWRRGAQSA